MDETDFKHIATDDIGDKEDKILSKKLHLIGQINGIT